jgi:CO/xanthine dehydrogenase Mo-binding subunit
VHDPGSYREAMEAAERVVDFAEFRARQRTARADGRWLGLGISVFAERTGPGTPAFAAPRMVINPGFERVELAMDPSGFLTSLIRRILPASKSHEHVLEAVQRRLDEHPEKNAPAARDGRASVRDN